MIGLQGLGGLANQLGEQLRPQPSTVQAYEIDRLQRYQAESHHRAMAEEQNRHDQLDYYRDHSRSTDKLHEMMRMAVDPHYEHRNVVNVAISNMKANARDIDKAKDVRTFLQAETDDWLEDAIKID